MENYLDSTDNGSFTINDIQLIIPPTKIDVSRQSFNYNWSTLRNRNTIKTKSGHSMIYIDVAAVFLDNEGYSQLRDILAGLRVTPFCWVENTYLKNTILGDNTEDQLVLACHNINIRKSDTDVNMIQVVFRFSYFNYKPYMSNWIYRMNILDTRTTTLPSDSEAWKMLYQAEQRKGKYFNIISELSDDLAIGYNEFILSNPLKTDTGLMPAKDIIAGLDYLQQNIRKKASISGEMLDLGATIEVPTEIQYQVADILGNTTSMELNLFSDMQITKSDGGKLTYKGLDWKAIYKDGEPVTINNRVLFARKSIINIKNAGLVVNGLDISFKHTLATMPLVGSIYPTYQHIGSSDGSVSIQMVTTQETPLRTLTSFYNSVENSAQYFNRIPPDARRVTVQNNIINMCGIHECMTEQMFINTVPGQVGVYTINLVLTDDKFLPVEEFSSEFAMSSNNIRQIIAKALVSNIVFFSNDKNIKEADSTFTTLNRNVKESIKGLTNTTSGKIIAGAALATAPLFMPPLAPHIVVLYGTSFGLQIGSKFSSRSITGPYYCTIPDSDYRKTKLRLASSQYSQMMSSLYIELRNLLTDSGGFFNAINGQGGSLANFNSDGGALLANIMSLKEDDLPGISKIQQDLMAEYALNKSFHQHNPGEKDVSLQKSINTMAIAQGNILKAQTDKNNPSLSLTPEDKANKDKDIENAWNDYNKTYGEVQGAATKFINDRYESLSRKVAEKKAGYISAVKAIDAADFSDPRQYLGMEKEELIRAGLENELRYKGRDEEFWKILIEYEKKARGIIDNWIARNILQESSFKKTLGDIYNELLQNNVTTYPDFPLKEIIQQVSLDQKSQSNGIGKMLFEEWSKYGWAAKNLGPSVLIGPDYYLINEVNDNVESLFDSTTIKQIKEIVSNSLDDYDLNYTGWINELASGGMASAARVGTSVNAAKKINEALLTRNVKNENTSIGNDVKAEANKYKVANTLTETSFVPDAFTSLTAENETKIEIAAQGFHEGKKISELWQKTQTDKRPIDPSKERASILRIKHQMGGREILKGGETNEVVLVPNSAPEPFVGGWQWPITGFKRISSGYKTYRTLLGKISKPHRGIDIGSNKWTNGKGDVEGQSILAVADGTIIDMKDGEELDEEQQAEYDKMTNEQKRKVKRSLRTGLIKIKHAQGYVSIYNHLQNSDKDPYLFGLLLISFSAGLTTQVKKGAMIGKVGNSGYSFGAHLHLEMMHKGQLVDPYETITGQRNVTHPVSGYTFSNENLMDSSIGEFGSEMRTQSRGMARAYPTFKLYFIESDFNERTEFGFDDFFSYASIKEIQFISNKDIAADVCMLQITNVSGNLSNRKFKNALTVSKKGKRLNKEGDVTSLEEDPENIWQMGTTEENPLTSMLVQPGIQIQLRLGYSNNPLLLSTVFNGVITEVQFSESEDLVFVTAQTFATELVQRIKGMENEEDSSSSDPRKVLCSLLTSSELVHFGRYEDTLRNNGEVFFRDTLNKRFKNVDNPVDQNVFAPGKGTSVLQLFDFSEKYKMFRTTIWDIFQEMTLRFPGYIARALPYEGRWGPRMTMYFGLPNQFYYARDPSPDEADLGATLSRVIEDAKKNGVIPSDEQMNENLRQSSVDMNSSAFKDNLEKIKAGSLDKNILIEAARDTISRKVKLIKPVIGYHLVTSDWHIIANNISSTASKTFNAVNLQYTPTLGERIFSNPIEFASKVGGTLARAAAPGTSAAGELYKGAKDTSGDQVKGNENTGQLETSHPDILSVVCDEVPDEARREFFANFPNCHGELMAHMYAISLLWKAMKKAYSGSLVIIGNPDVKVNDIIFIADRYSDMWGAIEVEQVIHKFSEQNGFITEIKPNMVIHINQTSTMATTEAMGKVALGAIAKIGGEPAADAISRVLLKIDQAKTWGTNIVTGAAVLAGGVGGGLTGAAGLGLLVNENVGRAADVATAVPKAAMATTLAVMNPLGPAGALLALAGSFAMYKVMEHTQYNHPFHFEPLIYRDTPLMRGLLNRYERGGLLHIASEHIRMSIEGVSESLVHHVQGFAPENWGFMRGAAMDWALGDEKAYTGPTQGRP